MKSNNKKSNTFGIVAMTLIVVFTIGGIYVAGRGNAAPAGGAPGSGGGTPVGSFGDLLNKPIPNFSLKDRDGNTYTAENLKGKKVVLFFNEGIMCYPACWNQVVALSTDPRLNGADTVSLSVVIDSKAQWDSAMQKMPELSKAKMVFDFDRSVSSDFGMLTAPSSMHYGSFPGHTYLVIDREGVVRYALDDPRMAINNDLIYRELQKIK
jgi:peroxiredoxin Q/BCP